ncbi:MAG: hypothetical protein ACFCVE_06730 [Phycisphaerae bacterium]
MPTFEFQIRDDAGNTGRVSVQAADRAQAIERVVGLGQTPLAVREVPGGWRGLVQSIGRWLGVANWDTSDLTPLVVEQAVTSNTKAEAPPEPDGIDVHVELPRPSRKIDAPKQVNRIDKAAEEALRLRQVYGTPEALERVIRPFILDDLTPPEAEAYHYFQAVIAITRQDESEAFRRLRLGLKLYPNSDRIRFTLAQQHEQLGEVDDCFALLAEMPEPQRQGPLALAAARFAYLWDQTDLAMQHLTPLIERHAGLLPPADGITAPGLQDVLRYAAGVLVDAGRHDDAATLVSRFEDDQQQTLADVLLWIRCHAAGDMKPLIEELSDRLAFSRGAIPIRLAILRAQEAEEGETAAKILQEPVVRRDHYGWLDDIRLLAAAEVAGRFDKVEREEELQREFVQEQPYLLEPHQAMFFNLIDYQQPLKKAYQAFRSDED